MEKLIELLNEYEKEKTNQNVRFWNYYQNWFHYLEDGQSYSELLIISKKYGFIKRLVENDKIDLENLQCVFSWNINKWKTLMEETDWYERYEWTEYEATESLIMLLSISDTPIEDLISYLK